MTAAPTRPARIRKVATSLQYKMSRPGGSTAAELLSRAQSNLERQRDDALGLLAGDVDRLAALRAARSAGSEAQIYGLSSALVDVAGLLSIDPFYEAAYSLCETASRMETAGIWRWPAIEVHVRALSFILLEPAVRSPAAAQLLDGLKAVRDHAGRAG